MKRRRDLFLRILRISLSKAKKKRRERKSFYLQEKKGGPELSQPWHSESAVDTGGKGRNFLIPAKKMTRQQATLLSRKEKEEPTYIFAPWEKEEQAITHYRLSTCFDEYASSRGKEGETILFHWEGEFGFR